MEKKLKKIRMILVIVFVGFVVFGVARGEVAVVFDKAIRICLECIGIG